MRKYLVAVVVILALLIFTGAVWSQYPTRDYYARYFYVSDLMQVNDNAPLLNLGYYYQTYNYNTADAFRVDYHGVGHYIMNLQANGTSVLLLNKDGDVGLGKVPSYRFDIATLDEDAQRGINFTSLSAGDGETIYGTYGAGTVGTGVCSADREVYGQYFDLTINSDADPGYAGIPYIYGSFYEFFGSTDAVTLKNAFGYVSHWGDYSGDATYYVGYLDSSMIGGTSVGISFEGSMNLENGDVLGATGTGFGIDILEAGTNDTFYGVNMNDTNLGVIGGTGYGLYIDLDDVNWDTVYSIYVNAGSAVSYFGNSVGINALSPDRALEVIDAGGPQIRATHTDATFYNEIATTGTGDLEITSNLGLLFKTVGADFNTFVGEHSGEDIAATGSLNTCVGHSAGMDITTSDYNTCVGGYAGQGITELSHYNTFIGAYAGRDPTDSSTGNTSVGYTALENVSTGDYNTAVGTQAIRGDAGGITGDHNTALGAIALAGLSSGTYNMGIGRESLNTCSSGHYNTGVGALSLRDLTAARQNTAIGYNSGVFNETGWSNTYIGANAGVGVTGQSHEHNTFIGAAAGVAVTTGDDNILIGYQAGDNLTSGEGNIVIAYDTDLPAAGTSNYLNIGGILKGDMNLNELHIPSELVLTPSAAQVIDAVGDAILANASYIELNPDGDYTLTSQPTIADGTKGQVIRITCADGEANIVTVQDEDTLANSNIHLGVASRAISGRDILVLVFNGSSWCEESYANN